MNYYRRYDEDGNCEVICTRCFATVGVASGSNAARRMEALHVCRKKTDREESNVIPINRDAGGSPEAAMSGGGFFPFSAKLKDLNAWVLFPAVVLLLYALPTVLELAATKHFNPWFAVILPGDAVGCAFLITVFKRPRTGIILYLLLTICEAALYEFHLVPVGDLIWIVDVVPTLVVSYLVLRGRIRSGLRQLRFF